MLNANVIDNPTSRLRWDINFNISHYTEEITELALRDAQGNAIDDIGNGWFLGRPIKVFFDYEKIGIYQIEEEELARNAEAKVPGEIKLKDQDGDGVITPDDRVVLGTDIPDVLGGLTNRFEYKGIDLSFFFYYRIGQMIKSGFHEGNNALFGRYNNLDVDYWTMDNPTNAFPRPNENQERPRNNTTLTYFDGSYIKLRNVTLGYNVPQNIAQKLKMSGLRVYLSAQNLWFWSAYETFDPEVDDDPEVDRGPDGMPDGIADPAEARDKTIPSSRLFLVGLNLKF